MGVLRGQSPLAVAATSRILRASQSCWHALRFARSRDQQEDLQVAIGNYRNIYRQRDRTDAKARPDGRKSATGRTQTPRPDGRKARPDGRRFSPCSGDRIHTLKAHKRHRTDAPKVTRRVRYVNRPWRGAPCPRSISGKSTAGPVECGIPDTQPNPHSGCGHDSGDRVVGRSPVQPRQASDRHRASPDACPWIRVCSHV